MDKDGTRLPFFNYAAISYLRSLDLKDKTVFEFGAGSSTYFWANVAKSVVAVEGHVGWYNRLKQDVPNNVTLYLAENEGVESYLAPLVSGNTKYDIIFIDGWHRPDCAKVALAYLNPGGIIIHDNTDAYPQTREILLGYDMIPVDFFGFVPLYTATAVTTFYFDRSFALKPSATPKWIPASLVENHELIVHKRD